MKEFLVKLKKNDIMIDNAIDKEYLELFLSGNNLESDLSDLEFNANYIMSLFWTKGHVLVFKYNGAVFFTDYAITSYDYRALPYKVRPLFPNLNKVVKIPSKVLTVGKDCVIGYYLNTKKPVIEMVSYYIDEIKRIDSAINFNREQLKVPWVFGHSKNGRNLAKSISSEIDKNSTIFSIPLPNNELENIKVLNLPVNFLIEKLQVQREKYESKIKSLLGVNNVNFEKKERLLTGEVDANNEEINSFNISQSKNVNDFCDKCKKVLGVKLTFHKTKEKEVDVNINEDYEGTENE